MTGLHDIALLRNVGNGDERSFELLYEKYWYQLYVAANKVLQDELAAEDIIQDIFISLWKNAPKLQVENLNAYLYQAVKYQVAKKIREKDNLDVYLQQVNRILEEKHEHIIDKLHYSELLQRVHVLVGQLPEKCKEIFIQSRFKHLSNTEIAAAHGITVKTVENQINKALRHLRHHMDDYSFLLAVQLCIELNRNISLQVIC